MSEQIDEPEDESKFQWNYLKETGVADAAFNLGWLKGDRENLLERIASLEAQLLTATEAEEESIAVIDKLSHLLAEIAITLKGEELALHRHGYHDLNDMVKALQSQLLTARNDALEEAANVCKQLDDEDGSAWSNSAITCAKRILALKG